jgi:hypothetical protein
MIGPHPTKGRARHCIACADAWLQSGQRSSISCVRSCWSVALCRRADASSSGICRRYWRTSARSWTALRRLIEDVREEWRSIDQRIKGYNDELAERVHNEEAAKRLTRIPGIGVLTATALVAAVGNAQTFSCGRDLAAWLGLVPRQATTGGKPRLLRISKRGNGYLRMLLIHGVRTALPGLAKKDLPLSRWLRLCLREHIATSCPWQTSWRGLLGRSLHVIAGMWLFKLRPVE